MAARIKLAVCNPKEAALSLSYAIRPDLSRDAPVGVEPTPRPPDEAARCNRRIHFLNFLNAPYNINIVRAIRPDDRRLR